MLTALTVAVYAAMVATGALAWQVVMWLRSHRTVVKVTHAKAWRVQREDGAEPVPDQRAVMAEELILVRAVNLSDHPVRIVEVHLQPEIDSEEVGIFTIQRAVGDDIPGTIQPHDAGICRFPLDRTEQDMSEPILAKVVLATGQVFFSQRRPLRSDERFENLELMSDSDPRG